MKVSVKMGKVKFSNAGFRAFLTHPKSQALTDKIARDWAAACGPGFSYRPDPTGKRARSTVFPDTPKAQRRDRRDMVILRNMPKGL